MRATRLLPFLIALVLVAALASPAGAATWSSVKIDDRGFDPDAAFRNGNTAVVYVKDIANQTADGISYATPDGSSWDREAIWTDDVSRVSANPQIALNDAGVPFVSFFSNALNDSPVLVRDGGVWVTETTLIDAKILDLQVFSTGELAVLWKQMPGNALWYTVIDVDANTFVLDEEVDAGPVGTASLILNSEDVADIVYSTGGVIRFAQQTQADWVIENASGTSTSARLPSITLSPGGQERIAYITNAGLTYAFRAGDDDWRHRLIHANSTATTPVIRTSIPGAPQIAYVTGSDPFALRWAVHTGNGWALSLIFSNVGGPSHGGISLVGSPNGTPRIAYNGLVTVRWAMRV